MIDLRRSTVELCDDDDYAAEELLPDRRSAVDTPCDLVNELR